MKALVTGGDGFLGQHLVAHLLDAGCEVAATSLADRRRPGGLSPQARDAVDWRRVDVLDSAAVAALVAAFRPRMIFHLAGFSSSVQARAHPRDALRVNAEGTLNVVLAAARTGLAVRRVVLAGSADAYGDGDGARIEESAPLRPVTLYGASKAAQEMAGLGAGAALGVQVAVARIFPLVGPGQRPMFFLPSLCRRALAIRRGTAKPELAVGNLDVTRDFTDVRDGAEAVAALGGLDSTIRRSYNVCSGKGLRLRRLMEWVVGAAGIDPDVTCDPGLVRRGEPEKLVGDPGRLHAATGWFARRDIQTTAAETLDWVAVGASCEGEAHYGLGKGDG